MKLRTLILAFGLMMLAFAGSVAAQTGSGFIGVLLQDSADGVLIAEIMPGSPAAESLQVDDVITALNDEAVTTAAEIAAVVQTLAPGDTITLTITRDGESQTVELQLGSAPPDAVGMGRGGDGRGNGNGEGRGNGNGGGRGNQPPMMQMLQAVIIYNPAENVWEVRQLSEDTALYAAGLREGDVVTAFNGESLDMMGLRELIASAGSDDISVNVTRDGADTALDIPATALVEFYAPMRMEGFEPVDPRFVMPGMMPGMRGLMMAQNGRLGVSFVTLDEESAAENEVEFVEGALIQTVEEGSPAAEAGVQVGDIVTAVNGEPVDQERTLRDRIFAYEPGDQVTLTVLRDGESQDIDVTLGEPLDMMFMPPGLEMPGMGMPMPPMMEPMHTPEPGMMPDATVTPGT